MYDGNAVSDEIERLTRAVMTIVRKYALAPEAKIPGSDGDLAGTGAITLAYYWTLHNAMALKEALTKIIGPEPVAKMEEKVRAERHTRLKLN
jgi:hypothetical protein